MKRLLLLLAVFIPNVARGADLRWLRLEASWFSNYNPSSFNTFAVNSATDAVEYVFQCREACAIDTLCVRLGTANGTPPQYQLSLQGVAAATGRADGSIKSSGNAKGTFTPSGSDDGTVKCVTVTSNYSCSRGEFLAIVGAGTGSPSNPDGSNYETFTTSNNNWPNQAVPHGFSVDSGVATSFAGPAPFGYKCGSAVYGNPVETVATRDFGLDSSFDEWGNYFVVPSGSCTTFKVGGFRFTGYMDLAGSSSIVSLYSGTTALQNLTIDGDYWHSAGSNNGAPLFFDEASLSTLNCGTAYRIAIAPQSNGGTKQGLGYFSTRAAGDMDAFPLGVNYYASKRVDGGAWTDVTTERMYIEPIIQDMTATSGGILGSPTSINGGMQ